MINKFLKLLISIFILSITYSCQATQEALIGSKRSDRSDEFLVQKKNPLTMPPDFEKLPTPGNQIKDTTVNINSSDIKKLLKFNENKKVNEINSDQTSSVESIILEKIQ